MTILNPPAFLQAGTYQARHDRVHMVSSMFQPSLTELFNHAVRDGVLPGWDPAYVNSSGWDTTISPFSCVIQNDFGVNQGDYIVANLANVVVTHAASSPTLNRRDIIGVRVRDAFYEGGAINQADVAIIQGTGSAGTPSDPALPASFMPIVRAVINAGSSAPVYQDMRRRTSVRGGIVPIFGNQFADAGRYPGETQYYSDQGTYRVWNGTAWRPYGPTEGRQSTVQLVSSGSAAANITQIQLGDPGGIWACVAGVAGELTRDSGDGRWDLGVNMGALGAGFAPGLPNQLTGGFINAGIGISGTLTGVQTAWFNVVRAFGGASTWSLGAFNYRAVAFQLLLRVPA